VVWRIYLSEVKSPNNVRVATTLFASLMDVKDDEKTGFFSIFDL
jgi:hypothetical protein